VVGRGSVNAQNAIDRRDCGVGAIFYHRSMVVRPGHVISTIPKAGVKLKAGANVDLVISLGTLPPPTAPCHVPDLVRKGVPPKDAIGITQAVIALNNANCLVGTVTLAFSHAVPASKVISTSPPAGTDIRSGPPVVNIVESEGKRP
jgi:serine/threonine-protein kinase